MSIENPNVWGYKTSGRFSADLIGWDDETGRRHPGTPERNNQDVDGLIIRVTDTHDPSRSQVFTVYKGPVTRTPSPQQWLKLISDTARRTGSPPGVPEFDLSDGYDGQ